MNMREMGSIFRTLFAVHVIPPDWSEAVPLRQYRRREDIAMKVAGRIGRLLERIYKEEVSPRARTQPYRIKLEKLADPYVPVQQHAIEVRVYTGREALFENELQCSWDLIQRRFITRCRDVVDALSYLAEAENPDVVTLVLGDSPSELGDILPVPAISVADTVQDLRDLGGKMQDWVIVEMENEAGEAVTLSVPIPRKGHVVVEKNLERRMRVWPTGVTVRDECWRIATDGPDQQISYDPESSSQDYREVICDALILSHALDVTVRAKRVMSAGRETLVDMELLSASLAECRIQGRLR